MAEETQQETRSAANKRLAKNTIALYIRMAIAMLVSLYTSRVVLQTLGVEDFGTYGIVGGIVVTFAFINNTLVSSIQRFLNFEIGKSNQDGVTRVFSNGFHIQVVFAAIIVLLAETLGLFYLNTYAKLPPGRLYAANWVFQFAILTTVSRLIRTPFMASVIAYERMTAYAIIGIVDVVMKLVIVYMLMISPIDKLISYAALGAVVSIGISLYYAYYSYSRFSDCRIQRFLDRPLLKQMLKFSGWNIFGSVSLLATFQGVDLIINYFHGVVANAVILIANQVFGATTCLTSGFQTAFNPQITKTYAKGDMNVLFDLIYRTTRYSFFLVIVCAVPLAFECGRLLELWLGTVPQYATDMCQFMILISVVDALAAPLWMSAYATGDIKRYQIIISSILLLNFPLTIAFMAAGFSPVWAIIIRFFVGIAGYIYRVIYMKTVLKMPIYGYLKDAIRPCALVLFPSMAAAFVVHYTLRLHTIVITSLLLFIVSAIILFLGLQNTERLALLKSVKAKVSLN